ncbi:MAG: complex I NDUFA9 subunit family protein, partial [Bauldia sp.]|nr:complex I NDUFA9 subunit family protein [Bauldia sp.]
ANLRYRWSVDRAVEGADAVVNLVAVLAPSGRQTFDTVHVFGARAVAEAARAAGLTSITHISAIGADPESDSDYARTKAEGEQAVLETLPDSVIMRPSIMFGPEDHFFNRFAAMARMSACLPLIGGGKTRFQPVFAGDVAAAIADSVEGKASAGTTYELGGPEIETFRDCMTMMLKEIDRKRLLVPVPWGVAGLMGRIGQHLPGKPLTLDQVRQLRQDNVVSEAAIAEGRTIASFGIRPTSLAAMLPAYLTRFRPHGEFENRPA